MTLHVNGIEIYYETMGNGPPMLLLHGNSVDHTFFHKLAPLLADRYTLYMPDSRCHGKSTKTEALGYDKMTDDMAAFIQALGLDGAVVLGSSDGGIVALMLAYRYPGLISAIIPCGASTHPSGSKKIFMFLIGLANRSAPDPKYEMMLNEPNITEEQLGSIHIPTLVLAGGRRDIVYVRHSRRLAKTIPGSKLHIFKGEGHTGYLTKRPEKCLAQVLPFLDSHTAT